MKLALTFVISTFAHDHSQRCKITLPVENLLPTVASALDCGPHIDSIPDTKISCTDEVVKSFANGDEDCSQCLIHYFDHHLEDDTECWIKYLVDEINGLECIQSIAESLYEICFASRQ